MVDTLLNVLWFLGIFFVGILIWAALSPFETMGWWAGWFGDTIYEEPVPSDGLLRRVHPPPHRRHRAVPHRLEQ